MWLPFRHVPLAALVFVACASPAREGGAGPAAGAWFVDRTAEIGLDFVHDSGAAGALWMPEIMGAGAALLDADGDGDLDVYLVNGAVDLGRRASSAGPRNRLYRQEADGTLADATAASGLGDSGYGMGVAVGDVDGDGDLDVYLANYGPDRLYLNRGDGTFADGTQRAGIRVDGWSASAVFCDYDLDGLLDLYVARYLAYDPSRACTDAAGRREYCQPKEFPGLTDVLLRNVGDGTFTDVTETAGLASAHDAGLGVVCADLNRDGWPDFYVANDLDPNRLWLNGPPGRFHDAAPLLGAAYNLEGAVESGMGLVAADLDGDLDLDLFVTNLEGQTNTLYRDLGGTAGFEDATAATGLAEDSLPFTGFGVVAPDVDLDGDADLVVANGRVFGGPVREPASMPSPWDRYAEPNRLYLNDGVGGFARLADSGLELPIEISRGMATGDYDGDGDVDLLVSNVQAPARLYRNDAPRFGGWLVVRATDPRGGADAIGATVSVTAGRRRQLRLVTRGSSYLSSLDASAHFGLGEAGAPVQIDVRWTDGVVERFDVADVDREVVVVRGAGRVVP